MSSQGDEDWVDSVRDSIHRPLRVKYHVLAGSKTSEAVRMLSKDHFVELSKEKSTYLTGKEVESDHYFLVRSVYSDGEVNSIRVASNKMGDVQITMSERVKGRTIKRPIVLYGNINSLIVNSQYLRRK